MFALGAKVDKVKKYLKFFPVVSIGKIDLIYISTLLKKILAYSHLLEGHS